jgi:hypothetical protein
MKLQTQPTKVSESEQWMGSVSNFQVFVAHKMPLL